MNHKKLNYFNITSVYICQPLGMLIPSNLKNLSIPFSCFLPPFSWNIPLFLKCHTDTSLFSFQDALRINCAPPRYFSIGLNSADPQAIHDLSSLPDELLYTPEAIFLSSISQPLSSLSAARTASSCCTQCTVDVCAPYFCLSPSP